MWGIRRNTRDLGYIAVFLIKLPMARKHEQQCVSNIVEATGSFVSFPQVECDKVGCCFDTVVNLFILGFFLTTPLFLMNTHSVGYCVHSVGYRSHYAYALVRHSVLILLIEINDDVQTTRLSSSPLCTKFCVNGP